MELLEIGQGNTFYVTSQSDLLYDSTLNLTTRGISHIYTLLMFSVSLFSSQKALDRYIATWDFTAQRPDELSLSKVRETKRLCIRYLTSITWRTLDVSEYHIMKEISKTS